MRKRRVRIEWLKASIAFMVMIIAAASADSEFFITPCVVTVLSLIYLRIVAIRLQKRGEF